MANMFEIKSSELALDKSQNDDVKKFAQQMIDDHTKAGDKLDDALSASNSEIQTADELDSKHQKRLDALSSLSGKDFDTQYIAIQLKAHQKAVALFSDYAGHGKNASVRDFAAKTLPTLKKHLKHVTALQSHQG
jgi:putative membrane protein